MPAGLVAFLICAVAQQMALSAAAAEAAATPLKYEEPKRLTGNIYAKGSTNLLFRFKRSATRSSSKLSVLREYTYPDGKAAARERATYYGDNLAAYDLEELQVGAAGRAIIQREPGDPPKGTIRFEYSKDAASGASPKASTEDLRKDTLVSDMVAEFLVSHWAQLARGEKVRCRYVVVPRRETVGFTFIMGADTTYKGRRAVIIRMEATSPIIARLVDPLIFTVEKEAPHHVLQIIGRVTPKLRVGNSWEDLDALTVFDWADGK
jgi:hypothetical protein